MKNKRPNSNSQLPISNPKSSIRNPQSVIRNPDDTARISVLRKKLEAWDVRPSKKLGQNFLVDGNALDVAVSALDPGPADCVIEIGAGAGALTRRLAERAGRVAAVELDRRLAAGLREDLGCLENVRVLEKDALAVDWRALHREEFGELTLKLVGNIPYSITGPLLESFLVPVIGASRMVLMLQREVGDRLLSGPGSRRYGSISLLAAYRCSLSRVRVVGRNCFWPAPGVDSILVRFDFYQEPPVKVSSEKHLFSVIRESFRMRRKMIKNALTNSSTLQYTKTHVISALEEAGINENDRPEDLDLSCFGRLSNALQEVDQ